MAEGKTALGWEDLKKMVAEVGSEDGPGSKAQKTERSETKRVNERFMRALRENNGKVPGELADMQALIIPTVGAKPGQKCAVPLEYQIVDGRLLVIASMAGATSNPPQFNNLLKTSKVLVEKDGESFSANAIVTAGSDRNSLFQKICTSEPTFAAYQARTDRIIKVVELRRK